MNKLNDKQELEERSAFYYLYYGQDVATFGNNQTFEVGHGGWNLRHPNCHLILTDLRDITDEHAIELAKIYEPYVKLCVSRRNTFSVRIAHVDDDGQHEFYTIYFDGEIDNGGNHGRTHDLQAYDYLRSHGYLLPFRGYTTKQLLDLGWVKLRTNN